LAALVDVAAAEFNILSRFHFLLNFLIDLRNRVHLSAIQVINVDNSFCLRLSNLTTSLINSGDGIHFRTIQVINVDNGFCLRLSNLSTSLINRGNGIHLSAIQVINVDNGRSLRLDNSFFYRLKILTSFLVNCNNRVHLWAIKIINMKCLRQWFGFNRFTGAIWCVVVSANLGRKVDFVASGLQLASVKLDFKEVTSLLCKKTLSLLNLDHQIVPNGLRYCTAWVVDLTLDCVVPARGNNLLASEDGSVDVLAEGLHDLCPFFLHLLADNLFILSAALGTFITSG
jgi:hypothetical protein